MFDREFAGASALGTLFAICIVGAVAVCLGYSIDVSNQFFTGLSADASNTIFLLEIGFGAAIILFLIAAIINHWMNEKSEANQGT